MAVIASSITHHPIFEDIRQIQNEPNPDNIRTQLSKLAEKLVMVDSRQEFYLDLDIVALQGVILPLNGNSSNVELIKRTCIAILKNSQSFSINQSSISSSSSSSSPIYSSLSSTSPTSETTPNLSFILTMTGPLQAIVATYLLRSEVDRIRNSNVNNAKAFATGQVSTNIIELEKYEEAEKYIYRCESYGIQQEVITQKMKEIKEEEIKEEMEMLSDIDLEARKRAIQALGNQGCERFLVSFFKGKSKHVACALIHRIKQILTLQEQYIAFSHILDKNIRTIVNLSSNLSNAMPMIKSVGEMWSCHLDDKSVEVILIDYDDCVLPPELASRSEITSLTITNAPKLLNISPVYQLKRLTSLSINADQLQISGNLVNLTQLTKLTISQACINRGLPCLPHTISVSSYK